MHISHTKSFNIPVSIALATIAHMIHLLSELKTRVFSNVLSAFRPYTVCSDESSGKMEVCLGHI